MFKCLSDMDRKEKKIQLAANIYIHLCGAQSLAYPENIASRAFVMAEAFMQELDKQNGK